MSMVGATISLCQSTNMHCILGGRGPDALFLVVVVVVRYRRSGSSGHHFHVRGVRDEMNTATVGTAEVYKSCVGR